MTFEELTSRTGHDMHCVMVAHESIEQAHGITWDEALERVEDAFSNGDVSCHCESSY